MISIIIPSLNEEHFLPPLLDAIRQQEADCEVIVVDGGSQDRTLEIARDHGVRTIVSFPVAPGSASVPRKLVARYCSSFTRIARCSLEHWIGSMRYSRPMRRLPPLPRCSRWA